MDAKTNKTFEYHIFDETYTIKLLIGKYLDNGRTAILAETLDGEEFATFTVNIDDHLVWGESFAYLDTNNVPGVKEFFIDNGLGTETGFIGYSGYCRYPLVSLNLDKLNEVAERIG